MKQKVFAIIFCLLRLSRDDLLTLLKEELSTEEPDKALDQLYAEGRIGFEWKDKEKVYFAKKGNK